MVRLAGIYHFKTKAMYIIKDGPLYLKEIGETSEKGLTQISLTIDESKALQFETADEAQTLKDRFDVGGEIVEA